MVTEADKQDIFANHFPDEKQKVSHPWRWGMFAFIVVFMLGVLFINSFLQRQLLISQLKKQTAYSIEALNQFGWDLAYDNISFHAFPLLPLGELNNVKLYNRHAHTSWNVEKIRFDNSILNTHKLNFDIIGKQFLTNDGRVHKIDIKNQELFVEIGDNGLIELFSLKLLNLSIKDIADAERFILLGKHIPSLKEDAQNPYFQTIAEISDIKLNGLLDYPLSQDIRKIYLDTSIIGKINLTDNFRSNLREWMAKDGHIEINDFNISWSPLLLVGKGNLYLNENFKPILQLNTTSKALIVLIDELERKNFLDSKGVFVAKILLSRKLFKSDENDEHFTVTTPISVRDDALLIEKIAVKKFNQPR